MPRIDTGSADGPPGAALKAVSVELSANEAHALLESLQEWADEIASGHPDPGWHTHVADAAGRELTIAVRLT